MTIEWGDLVHVDVEEYTYLDVSLLPHGQMGAALIDVSQGHRENRKSNPFDTLVVVLK